MIKELQEFAEKYSLSLDDPYLFEKYMQDKMAEMEYNMDINNAYKQGYDEAYNKAYDEAYNKAYDEAYNKAYDEAYKETYDEDLCE